MMMIETQDLRLNLLPEDGTFELRSRIFDHAAFRSRINAHIMLNRKPISLLGDSWHVLLIEDSVIEETRNGPIRQFNCHLNTCLTKVSVILKLGLSLGEPVAFVQLAVRNRGEQTLLIDGLTLLDIQPGALHFAQDDNPDPVFYSNGWQSWSHTGSYQWNEKQPTSILGKFQTPMVINAGTPKPGGKNHFTGDMFGMLGDQRSRVGLLTGFLSQKTHFGSLKTHFNPSPGLRVWANGDQTPLPPGEIITTDPLLVTFVDLDQAEPLNPYLQAVAREHEIQSEEPVPVGWCSWYQFYTDITEENIVSNLDAVIDLQPTLPLPLFQIDDGYETYPGDWFDFDPAFPQGVKPLVEKATNADLTPGIWLAPYIVHPKANLVKAHPDWLLRDASGKLVTAGFVWNTFTYALDLTHPEALAYTCEVIHTAVEDWGFRYLKLDFLYAAALNGVYQNPSLTRAQVLRKGLEALRKAAGPDVTMLACGCPLGSALGLFEAMRISADVSGRWQPHFPPISPLLQKEPHMPSARNAFHNILTRAPLHRHWWINDPDCLLVRPDTTLTLAEVQSLTSVIGLTGGSVLVSDDLPALPADRLRLAQLLLPVIDQRARVMDLFSAQTPACLRVDLTGPAGPWRLLAKFNWADQPADLSFSLDEFGLPETSVWWLREFWTGTTGQMAANLPFTFEAVPPHGMRVLAVRPCIESQPTYIGSDVHLSQGLEVSQWRAGQDQLSLTFHLGHQISGRIHLYLPWQLKRAVFGGEAIEVHSQEPGSGIYSLDLKNLDGKELVISA